MVSTEDTGEIWETAKEEEMEKVRGRTTGPTKTDSPMTDEEEVERSFCLSRPDGWVVNRKMKKIILLEFKRTSDVTEAYFQDMWKVTKKQHTPILTGLRALTEERGWEADVVPLVVGHRSVREEGW